MAHVYIIGGAPRVGKTILAMRIIKKRPMFAISADSIRDMLRGVMNSSALSAIHDRTQNESAFATFLRIHPREGVKLQNDESKIVWPSVNELIMSYLADGQDVLVEGVEILPHLLAAATYDYRAVFLGNTSSEHSNTIAAQAHARPHDWMHDYADDTVDAWANLVRVYSRFIQQEAKNLGMPYVETHDHNFQQSLAEAEQILLK